MKQLVWTTLKVTLTTAMMAGSLLPSPHAHADDDARWSMGLGIGPNLTNMDAVGDKLKSSWGGAVWLSREWGERSRLDLSLDYFKFSGGGRDYPSLNLAYGWRFFRDSRFKPFALLGAGVGKANNFPLTENTSQTTFNLFGRVGLDNLLMGEKWSIGLIGDFEHVFMDGKPITSAQLALPMLTFVWRFDNTRKTEAEPKYEKPAPVSSYEEEPLKDSDGDGVYDYLDECPRTPRGKRVNSIGCEPKQKIVKTLKVEFETAKSKILPNFMRDVKEFGDWLKKNPDLNVSIEGHTDSVGSRSSNIKLSRDRAAAVRTALVKYGIEARRLTSKGFGPDKPVADNKTPSGRQMNRRVNAVIQSR